MLEGCTAWPDDDVSRFRRDGFWRGERLGSLTRDVAAADPGRTALVTASGRWSYGELDRRADRLAAGLHARGVRALDRAVVALQNGPDFVTLSIALFRLGALPVYALPSHRRSELEHLCRETDATLLAVADSHRGEDLRAVAGEVAGAVPCVRHVLVAGDPGPHTALASVDAGPLDLPEPDPQEVAFFLLSGGTTGMPKLIPRTHDDYMHQLRCSAEVVGADEHAVYLAALPVAHNAALGCPGLLGTLRLGGRVVLTASPSPDEVFPLVAQERPTLTTVMPTFLLLWSETAELFGADLSGVVVEVGGASLDPQLARSVQRRLGCTLTHWFGMAEGVLCCTRPEDGPELAAATQGRPICPADELRIVDDAGVAVAPGAEGELQARGPMTLRGYYRAPEHNRRAFTSDGFLRTGDLVRLTPDGNLVVTGRIKDVINRGGEKVSPGEVEAQLRSHPGVRDVAVVAMADPVLGERACAFVVAGASPPRLHDLRAHLVANGVAEYKLPDRVELIEALPLTRLGKVDKARLRDRLAAEPQDAGARLARPGASVH